MQTKTCTKCGEEKELTEFYKKKAGKYGVTAQCKECISELGREYDRRPEVRERKRESRREYRSRPEIREYHREYQREYQRRPEIRERNRKRRHELMQRPEVKESERLRYQIREQSPERLEYKREIRKKRKEMGLVYESKGIEIAKKHATRKGRWSDAEVKFLMTSELPLVDIALELGRTYSSVAQRRHELLHSR